MKLKQTFIIILLVILAGTIFYFGWIQIELPENTYGIVFTKTRGYLPKVYEPGKFSWNIQKLIPWNFKLLKFNLISQHLDINEQGQLPAGNIYSDYLPGKPDFSYNFKYYLNYNINLDYLPQLVSKFNLVPEQMPEIYLKQNSEIQIFISNFYKTKALDTNSSIDLFYKSNDISKELFNLLSDNFPNLIINEFVCSNIKIPDAMLYSKAKEIYLASINLQNKVISESKLKVAEQEIIDNANFETLKKYGELLKQYPSLIDFFAVIDIGSDTIFPQLNIELPVENNN